MCVCVCVQVLLTQNLLFFAAVNSMLYSTNSPATVSTNPPIQFDPQLGLFMRNTFVLAHEYMFVQVHLIFPYTIQTQTVLSIYNNDV